MMKRVLFAFLFATSAALADESEETSSSTEGTSEAEGAAEAAAKPAKEAPKPKFITLPLCRRVEGPVFVRPFGAKEWLPAEEGHFYPLGTAFRTEGAGRLTVAFAKDAFAYIANDAEFVTRQQPLGVPSRTISLVRGTLDLSLADNLPDGAFFVVAPGFVVKNLAGESSYVYEGVGDGDKAVIACKTGALGVEGRHFDIPVMRSANSIVIRTSRDLLSTFLYGKTGNCPVKIDKNMRFKEELGEDGKMIRTPERQSAEFHLSPGTKVVIQRSVPAIGERMSAFIMAFDASGERLGDGVSVCEGRAEFNTGELVNKVKLSGSELAKKAAEATETTAAGNADSGEKESEEAKSGDDSSDSGSDSNEK